MKDNLKVLIVEDELFVAMDLKRQIIKHLGFIVLTPVGIGETAVEVAEKERPDIIFMDIVLSSRMNGVEAARRIKNIYHPLIIFTSGYIDETISAEIDSLNAHKIFKPYEFEAVKNIFNKEGFV
jgi:CheY-like chemotaxis protein